MKTIKFVIGIIVVIIILVIILVVMQSMGAFNIPFLEEIRTTGLLTYGKNLWLENITPFWNEQIVPMWK